MLSRTTIMLLLHLTIITLLNPAGAATAANALSLPASEPQTIYYTTSGAAPTAIPTDSYPVPPKSAGTTYPAKPKPEESPENKQKNKELKKMLLKKYDLDKEALTIRLEHTPHGPKGHLHISGKMSPTNIPKKNNSLVLKLNKDSNAEAIALAFLEEEADLLGITDLNEYISHRIVVSAEGYTNIFFGRHINGISLDDTAIRVTVSPELFISSVSATLELAPPQLYAMAKQDTLPEEQIREIAVKVFKEVDHYSDLTNIKKSMTVQKIAIPTPPYILWKVESRWQILFDAFTGDVLEKRDLIIIN